MLHFYLVKYTPVVPLIFILVFKWSIDTSFIVGMVYCILATQWKTKFAGTMDMLNKACFDGLANISMPLVMFMGVGIIITAARHELLSGPISWILGQVIPTTPLMVIVAFGVIGPFLTMYRGPLNPWGLGAALAAILAGALPAGFLVAMFWVYDYFVGVNDPTASQVIWSTGYLQLPIPKYTKATILFNWAFSLVGIIIAVIWFM